MWHLRLVLEAGKGGDGIISWSRNRYNSRMGPAGGDGGQGGSVLLKVDSKFSDFSHIKGRSLKAQNGNNGRKAGKNGGNGSDLVLEIPSNTEIYDLDKKIKKVTCNKLQSSYLLCKGGRGGRGNKSFKNAQFQSPWLYELGEKGEKINVLLKLSTASFMGVISLSEISTLQLLTNQLLIKNRIETFEFPKTIFNKKENIKKNVSWQFRTM